MPLTNRDAILRLIEARHPAIALTTSEERYALSILREAALHARRGFYVWDCVNGLRDGMVKHSLPLKDTEPAGGALAHVEQHPKADDVYVFLDLGDHLDKDPQCRRLVRDAIHRLATGDGPAMQITGTDATIDRNFKQFGFTSSTGPREEIADVQDFRPHMLEAFTRAIRGLGQRTAVATLEVARAHTVVVNGASQAAPVRPVPPQYIEAVGDGGGQVQTIPGLHEAFRYCGEQNVMLHDSGRLGFTRPAGRLDLAGYDHFAGPHPETRPTRG